MNQYNTVESVPESLQRSDVKKLICTRVVVIILMLYLAIMVIVAYHGLIGDVFAGFYWRSSGWSLFPIPIDPTWFGVGVYMMLVPLTFFELPVYLIFVGHSIWIFWEVVGVLYIVYPWVPFLQSVVKRGKSIIANRFRRSG